MYLVALSKEITQCRPLLSSVYRRNFKTCSLRNDFLFKETMTYQRFRNNKVVCDQRRILFKIQTPAFTE